MCVALLGLGALLLGCTAAGIQLFVCPLRALTGVPCPGCGLTRGMVALLRGDVRAALTFHPFVPLFGLGLVLVVLAAALPEGPRGRLLRGVRRLESRTPLGYVLALSLLAFGIWRAAFGAPV